MEDELKIMLIFGGACIAVGIGLIWFWRFWRGFLAPANVICDRDHMKSVNYFYWMLLALHWVLVWLLAREIWPEEWLLIKEALYLDDIPYL